MSLEDLKLNIVIPMAGRGSRFADAGYAIPKPLIPLDGRPMIQWVIENVKPQRAHRFIFICQKDHMARYPEVPDTLRTLCPGCIIVELDGITDGAACTVLSARDFIDSSVPLMIANSDQYVDLDIEEYLAVTDESEVDGLIMTFESDHPKWSYCRMRDDGTVSEVVEKVVVSNEATVGIYNFRRGADFVKAADMMIEQNLRVNNEFYVAPVYNPLINQGSRILVKSTGKEGHGMYGLGTPEDYAFFQSTSAFRAALNK